MIQALKREIWEETALRDVKVGNLLTLVEGFFPIGEESCDIL